MISMTILETGETLNLPGPRDYQYNKFRIVKRTYNTGPVSYVKYVIQKKRRFLFWSWWSDRHKWYESLYVADYNYSYSDLTEAIEWYQYYEKDLPSLQDKVIEPAIAHSAIIETIKEISPELPD